MIYIVQPVLEYTKMNPKDFKNSLYESTLINKNKFYYYNKSENIQSKLCTLRTCRLRETQSKLRSRQFNTIVDHERGRSRGLFFSSSFSSLFNKNRLKTSSYNKQYGTSVPLAKYPTTDIKVMPMFMDEVFPKDNLCQARVALKSSVDSKSLLPTKRPINLSPFLVSFQVPMGIDSIFKNQNVSFSHQYLSYFDYLGNPTLSSKFVSFFDFYLQRIAMSAFEFGSHSSRNLLSQAGSFENMFHLLPKLIESPCFSFYNLFKFKNPIVHFPDLKKHLQQKAGSQQSISRLVLRSRESRLFLENDKKPPAREGAREGAREDAREGAREGDP